MMSIVKIAIKNVLKRCGYEVRRISPSEESSSKAGLINTIHEGSRLNVGFGGRTLPGYHNADKRVMKGVDLVCSCWKISKYCKQLKAVYSRHLLEHLTLSEVLFCLEDWYSALAVGGSIEIIVPNLNYHIKKQWDKAVWCPDSFEDLKSDARWGLAGLYGWQRECDPRKQDYAPTYWDVHKCGFSEELLLFLLKKSGYADVSISTVEEVHLRAEARKITEKGERQVTAYLEYIRPDHLQRYRFASLYVHPGDRVLDIACGIGYGSHVLSKLTPAAKIDGVDIDEGAIAYANEYYRTEKVSFYVHDASTIKGSNELYDLVVSFETIEHIKQYKQFLINVSNLLKSGGTFICSTPNQNTMPYAKTNFPFHIRHFTSEEFRRELEGIGLSIKSMYSQHDHDPGNVIENRDGLFLVAVCVKK